MDTIQNKGELLKYHGKYKSFKICLCALEKALKSVDPYLLIKNSITIEKQFSNKKKFTEHANYQISHNDILKIKDVKKTSFNFDLGQFNSIHIIGAGKATAKMAIALEEILRKKKYHIDSGAINIPYDEKIKPNFLIVNEASHPVPDKNSVKGTKTILDLLKNIKGRALVFGLISGGASSLLCAPISGLDLRSKQEITKLLLKSGASIHEINKVRKHLSSIKGGNLVRNINPDTIFVTLILSDVVGDDLNIIGSGPTVGDNSTYTDAIKILKKYRIWDLLDIKRMKKVKNTLEMGRNGDLQELPRPSDAFFNNVYNILIGNNELACKSAVSHIKQTGAKTFYLGSDFTSEAKTFGKNLASILLNDKFQRDEIEKEKKLQYNQSKHKILAFVLGGETVVKIESSNPNNKPKRNTRSTNIYKIGQGGRNQEAILSSIAYLKLAKIKDYTVLCCGTDGIDGNSTYAGGIVTPTTINRSIYEKLDLNEYLVSHNSSTYLKKVKSVIKTGRTGTNVNDISIVCKIL